MVRLIFWQPRRTENRPLSSLELSVYSQPVALLQEGEVLRNRNQASSATGQVSPLLTWGSPQEGLLWEIEDRSLCLQDTSVLTPGCHAELGPLTLEFSSGTSELWHQYLGNIRKERWNVVNDSLLLHMWQGQRGQWLMTTCSANLNSHHFNTKDFIFCFTEKAEKSTKKTDMHLWLYTDALILY